MRGELATAERVPFGALVAPNVCKLYGRNAYVSTWRMGGVPFETSTPEVIGRRVEALAAVYRNLGGGNLSYWVHRIGRQVHVELSHPFENFPAQVDAKFTTSQRARGFSLAETYLTLVYESDQPTKKRSWFRKDSATRQEIETDQAVTMTAFEEACARAEAMLQEFKPERLTGVVKRGREYSELATFFGFLLNGVWRDQPVARSTLRASLPSSFLHFGDWSGRVQITNGDTVRHAAILDILDYPPEGMAGDFNSILGVGCEFIETHSFQTYDKRAGIDALEITANQLESGGDASQAEMEAVADMLEDARDGRLVLGKYHFSLALIAATPEDAQRAANAVRREVAAYALADVRLIPEAAWFAQLPGAFDERPRTALMTSRNFAGLAPMHVYPVGKLVGNPWGEAVTVFRGSGNQPYAFNWHVPAMDLERTDEKDPGNTIVFGTIGSGKTALVMFLLAQSARFGARAFVLDKDRGCDIAIRAMCGTYTYFERGTPSGINTFQWEDTHETRELCRRVVKECVTRGSQTLSPKDEADIAAAVNSVFGSLPFEQRRLAAVDDFLPAGADNHLSLGLAKWIKEGEHAWAFDCQTNTIHTRGQVVGFDCTLFTGDEELRNPATLILMSLRESMVDGNPFISVIDEFWLPLRDEQLAKDEQNFQKTGRKRSIVPVLMTQSVSDAIEHPHARTLIEMGVTKIFLPNPEAIASEYVDVLGLSAREFELVKGLNQYSRTALIKQGSNSALVNVDLGALADELIALSGSLDNTLLCEEVRREHGDDPAVWFPVLVRAVKNRKRNAVGVS